MGRAWLACQQALACWRYPPSRHEPGAGSRGAAGAERSELALDAGAGSWQIFYPVTHGDPGRTKIKGLGVPADRIYVCNSLTKEIELVQISSLIHELAHFVSGQPLKISHDLGVPKQGDMLKDRTALDRITPEAKLRSAEHYAFFAMAAGFRRVSTD